MSERRSRYAGGSLNYPAAEIRLAAKIFLRYRERGHSVPKAIFFAARQRGLNDHLLAAYLIQVGASQLAQDADESLHLLVGALYEQGISLPTKRPLKAWRPDSWGKGRALCDSLKARGDWRKGEEKMQVAQIEKDDDWMLLYSSEGWEMRGGCLYAILTPKEEKVKVGDWIEYEPVGVNFGWFIRNLGPRKEEG